MSFESLLTDSAQVLRKGKVRNVAGGFKEGWHPIGQPFACKFSDHKGMGSRDKEREVRDMQTFLSTFNIFAETGLDVQEDDRIIRLDESRFKGLVFEVKGIREPHGHHLEITAEQLQGQGKPKQEGETDAG